MEDKIAVVTPYYKESPEMLWKAHESVKAQGPGVFHIMIADGHPDPEVATWDVQHVMLPRSHGDNGNTPRGIGGILAQAQHCNYVAYLDADNWFFPDHINSLVDLQKTTGYHISASLRHFYAWDGTFMTNVSEYDENEHRHVDTSCILVHQSGFSALSIWTQIPKPLSPICDRIFCAWLRQNRFAIAHSNQRTVAFRSQYEGHYHAAGLTPPQNCKTTIMDAPVKWLFSADGIRETVNRLGFFPM